MFEKKQFEIEDENGRPFEIGVHYVDIEPEAARRIFETGTPAGTWGWKHQTWTVATELELMEVQAAARYYYGWQDGTEKITAHADGTFTFEAYYAC